MSDTFENKVNINYEAGTLVLDRLQDNIAKLTESIWDERINKYRLPAYKYYNLIKELHRNNVDYIDEARNYKELNLSSKIKLDAFPYQEEALNEWVKGNKRGVVILPTGAGKSYLATLAIEKANRSTLVIVPTIDLMNQWYDILHSAFDLPIGLIGGGYYELTDLTVTTYDSAYLYMERFGNKFGLMIFDECHHLPSETYSLAAKLSISPFRLGLTATLERTDGKEEFIHDLVGPILYSKDIKELSGEYLSEYETVTLYVEMTEEQKSEYKHYRQIYTDFLRNKRINMSNPNGWNMFIILSSKDKEGREAFLAYKKQKELFLATDGKLNVLESLLHQHRQDYMLIFTENNQTVFDISVKYLIPTITHLTKTKERHEILSGFNKGEYRVIATSKVLNEGINVPEANVAVIISGNSSVREHVQRLGRILRKRENKSAILYEIITKESAEEYMRIRRRKHNAYQ